MSIFEEEYQAVYRRFCREDEILSNAELSFADRVILVTLERLYPSVMTKLTPIQVWKLVKAAGASRSSFERFCQSMRERGYMDYLSKLVTTTVDGKLEFKREVSLQELLPCKQPRLLNTIDVTSRKEHRRKAKERLQCRVCGSFDVRIEVRAICNDCGRELT